MIKGRTNNEKTKWGADRVKSLEQNRGKSFADSSRQCEPVIKNCEVLDLFCSRAFIGHLTAGHYRYNSFRARPGRQSTALVNSVQREVVIINLGEGRMISGGAVWCSDIVGKCGLARVGRRRTSQQMGNLVRRHLNGRGMYGRQNKEITPGACPLIV